MLSDIYVDDVGKLHKVQGGADSVISFNKQENAKIINCGTNYFKARTNSTKNVSSYITGTGYTLSEITINNFFLKPLSMFGNENKEVDSQSFSFTFSYNNEIITTNGGNPYYVNLT